MHYALEHSQASFETYSYKLQQSPSEPAKHINPAL